MSNPTASERAHACVLGMGGLTEDMRGFSETVDEVAAAIRAAVAAEQDRWVRGLTTARCRACAKGVIHNCTGARLAELIREDPTDA